MRQVLPGRHEARIVGPAAWCTSIPCWSRRRTPASGSPPRTVEPGRPATRRARSERVDQLAAAALQSAAQGETTRTILTALALNLLVAVATLVAGLLSGSAALLAEAGYSLADSLNEVPLGISVRRGRVPADPARPLGHGREGFLWAFLAAIASFLIGGSCRSAWPFGSSSRAPRPAACSSPGWCWSSPSRRTVSRCTLSRPVRRTP
jgi:Cation efflux family